MSPGASGNRNAGDVSLIAAFQAGDVRAFETLYREYFERLCDYVATIVAVEDARDVVQDVLWMLWNARERLSLGRDEELEYYLLRAVRNRALDLIRRERVRAAHVSEVRESVVEESEARLSLTHESEHDALITRVQQLIETLPPRTREILVLRWQHGLSLEQIAKVMGISYGYARVSHARALEMVRERLKGINIS